MFDEALEQFTKRTTRILDFGCGTGDSLAREHYLTLDKNASDCIKCGHCSSRCPFSVDQMTEIKEYFN